MPESAESRTSAISTTPLFFIEQHSTRMAATPGAAVLNRAMLSGDVLKSRVRWTGNFLAESVGIVLRRSRSVCSHFGGGLLRSRARPGFDSRGNRDPFLFAGRKDFPAHGPAGPPGRIGNR